ncbi:MAG: hypothetical protein ABI743_11935, partial [bacterium]
MKLEDLPVLTREFNPAVPDWTIAVAKQTRDILRQTPSAQQLQDRIHQIMESPLDTPIGRVGDVCVVVRKQVGGRTPVLSLVGRSLSTGAERPLWDQSMGTEEESLISASVSSAQGVVALLTKKKSGTITVRTVRVADGSFRTLADELKRARPLGWAAGGHRFYVQEDAYYCWSIEERATSRFHLSPYPGGTFARLAIDGSHLIFDNHRGA